MIRILFFLSILTSCASYQTGNFAYRESGKHPAAFPITAEVDKALASDNFIVINFTFGNLSNSWKRVKKVRLKFKDKKENENIKITVGNDLTAWREGINHKVAIDKYNRDVLLGSLAMAGAAIASTSNKSSNIKAGLILTSASISVGATNELIDKIDGLHRGAIVPQTHLYNPFSVPPKLYIKRWVVLEVPPTIKAPNKLWFTVDYEDGTSAEYSLKLINRAF